MNIDTVALLTSARGWSLLAALPAYDQKTAVSLGESLRAAGYEPDLVAAALTQSRLRARARAKFGPFADGMLFTPDGLEQATRLELAARHAERFTQAGIPAVFDLGCGIGSDAMAMSALGLAVTAVDSDPATAALAGINLRHFAQSRSQLARADEITLPATGVGVWLDPARRETGPTSTGPRPRRITALESMSPPWSFVQSVAEQVQATGAKLAPSFPHNAIPEGTEAQWTSLAGEVLECALWWGPLVRTSGRTAAILTPPGAPAAQGDPSSSSTEDPSQSAPAAPAALSASSTPAAKLMLVTEADAADLAASRSGPVRAGLPTPGEYLYEPDRAVIAAGLVGALIVAVDGADLSPAVGYVTSARAAHIPWATRYVVTHAMTANPKRVRAWLRTQGAGRLTLKRRGGRIDPDTFRAQLKLDGRGNEVIAILTRVGSTSAFIAVERG